MLMELVHGYTYLKVNQIRRFEYVCLLEQRTGVFVKFRKGYNSVGSFLDFEEMKFQKKDRLEPVVGH